MIFSRRECFKLTFNAFCAMIVTIMAGYWFWKYSINDRSINAVDYVPIKETSDIKLPVASLCFDSPFSKQRFNDFDHTVNVSNYLKYINGDIQGKEFEDIDYRKVTLNIGDYFIGGWELRIKETDYRNISLTFDHIATFNGFYYDYLTKCFSIRIADEKQNHIKELILMYDREYLMKDWIGNYGINKIGYSMHYPGQFLLGELNAGISFENPLKIVVKELEILRRRNERNKKCIENSNSFDERVVNRHILDEGCRPTYLDGEDQSHLCRSMKKLKKSRFEYATIRSIDIVPDCQVVSKLEEFQKDWILTGIVLEKEELNSTLVVQVIYPDKIKIITSSKEIDIHTLIGNIGGYLGLFLGYALVQLPDMIFFIYDYIKIQLQRKKDMIAHSTAKIQCGNENVKYFPESNNFLNNANPQEDSIVDTNVP